MDVPNGGAPLNTTIMRLVLDTFRTENEQDCREIATIVDQNRHAFSLLDMNVFKAAWDKDYIKISKLADHRHDSLYNDAWRQPGLKVKWQSDKPL